MIKSRIDGEENVEDKIKKSDQREDVNERGLTDTAKTTRASNVELDRKLENEIKSWEKEVQGTNTLKKEHDDIMKKYHDSVEKFAKLMESVADARHKVDQDLVDTNQKQLHEISRRDVLALKKALSGQEVSHLSNTVSVYKKEMQELAGKYASFQSGLAKVISKQE